MITSALTGTLLFIAQHVLLALIYLLFFVQLQRCCFKAAQNCFYYCLLNWRQSAYILLQDNSAIILSPELQGST